MQNVFEDFTLKEQLYIIKFVLRAIKNVWTWFKNEKTIFIIRENYYSWIDQYKLGDTNVWLLHRSRRPIEGSNALGENRIKTLIQEGRRITVDQIAETCQGELEEKVNPAVWVNDGVYRLRKCFFSRTKLDLTSLVKHWKLLKITLKSSTLPRNCPDLAP